MRVYANTTDLANFLQDVPPTDSAKMLKDASRKMDGVLLTAVYATDTDGMPSNTAQRRAIADATCAIVEWWMETGDTLGTDGNWTSASAGNVSLSRDAGSTTVVGNERIPWKAWNILTAEGVPVAVTASFGVAELDGESLGARIQVGLEHDDHAARPRLVRGKGELSYVSTGGTADCASCSTC
mgnify:CR=1 FL=1